MRAWMTGADVTLQDAAQPVPVPAVDQVLVHVRAAALNNGDLNGSGAEHIAGFEFSGEVVAVGSGVDTATAGGRVFGIAEGALAEYVVAHHRHVLPTPAELTDVEAAATPTAYTTELGAALTGPISAGATVLVTAASSSIGLVAVQVAKELGASRVLATTRSRDKVAALEAVGADTVLVTDNDGISAATLDATDGTGADVVLDHIGGDALDSVVAAAKDGGTVISVGRLGGGTGTVDLFALARRHVLLRSVSYGLTPPAVLGDLFDGVAETLIPAITAGRIRPVVGAIHPFEAAPAALEEFRAGKTVGKTVITVP